MSRVTHKLRDQSGVTILMALFLSLVCVVISAVIFAAGTTVSGRFANLGTMDQRYYGVTSAVDYIKNDLDKNVITVTEELSYQESVYSDTITISSYKIYLNDELPRKNGINSFAGILSEWMVLGPNDSHVQPSITTISQLYEWEYALPFNTGVAGVPLNLTISGSGTHGGSSVNYEQLGVTVQVVLEESTGDASFVINNVSTGPKSIVYGVQARFNLRDSDGRILPEPNEVSRNPITSTDSEGNEYIVGYNVVVRKTTKLKWSFGDVSTLNRW